MTINLADVYASLEIMWKGMAGLFTVCGFIMLLTMIISKIAMSKEQKNQGTAD